MEPADLPTDILKDIRARRIVDSEIRTSTAFTALAGTMTEMTNVLRVAYDLRPRI